MAKFLVTMGFTTICTHEVEAHSFEEAKAKAKELEWDYNTESESDVEVVDIDLMPGQMHLLDQL